jgi:hypothetical protein
MADRTAAPDQGSSVADGTGTDSARGGVVVDDRPATAVAPGGGRPGARRVVLAVGAVLAVGLAALAGTQALNGTTGREMRDQRVVLPSSVTRLEVTISSGDLVLTAAGGGPAVADAHLSGVVRPPRLRVDLAGGTARLRADCGWNFLLSCGATLRLRVPAGVAVQARTSSGDIHATGLSGSFDLHTSSGDVTATGGSGQARLSTSSGDIHAAGLTATSVTTHSSSGDVTVRLAAEPDDVTASSSSGDVRITVPDETGPYLVSVHTSSGDRRIEVSTDPRATRKITARTGSGDVSVAYSPADQGS